MPYDPNWDLEDETGTAFGNYSPAVDSGGFSYGYSAEDVSGEEVEEEEQQADNEPEHGNLRDSMEVDQPGPVQSPPPKRDADATPKRSLPFPGAAELARLPQVEVVLHSSPRKPAYTAVADGPATGSEGETELITSDLLPRRRRKTSDASAAAPTPAPTKAPAPVAPAPRPAVTPQPNKRGRPVGWRLGYGSYSAMRMGVVPPASTTPRPKPKRPAGESRPRGRPGRRPAPTARQVYLGLNPHFVSFHCEWEGCPAELQNLETLRRHLLVVHGRARLPSRTRTPMTSLSPTHNPAKDAPAPAHSITCKWASCSAGPFPSLESFETHAENAHLVPFLWHVGDGPRNTTPSPSLSTAASKSSNSSPAATTATSTALPSYLFDARGEQVTPSVGAQQTETDEDRRRRQARISRVLALRDQHAPEEPAYTARQRQIIAEAAGAKQARLRMFEEYAARVARGGEGMEGWRPR